MGLLITAALACVQAPGRGDIGQVFREIVQVAETDARAAAGSRGGTGPLLVDVGSFALAATQAMGGSITDREVREAIGPEAKAVSYAAAVRCGPPNSPCGVADDGVLVRLDSLRSTPKGLRAVVTSVTTSRRRSGRSAICDRQLALTFDLRASRWILEDRRVLLMC